MNLKSKAKENISYKKIVDKESHNELKQISKYSKALWIRLIELHLKKMNYVITEDFSIPTKNISQSEIFRNQLDKYLYKDITVAV
jgi:hypothetical protein